MISDYKERILSARYMLPPKLQAVIKNATCDDSPGKYKTLVPIVKKRKTKDPRKLLVYMVKDGHRNRLIFKGRRRQLLKWWRQRWGIRF